MAPAGLDWLSALKTADLRKLLKPLKDGRPAPLQPEDLQPDAVAEIVSPDFPGERLVVCLNPRLAEARARKREDLLQATQPTPLQRRAFELLDVDPGKMFPVRVQVE